MDVTLLKCEILLKSLYLLLNLIMLLHAVEVAQVNRKLNYCAPENNELTNSLPKT